MDKVLYMTYASSITDLCEFNSSFDRGVLKIAYPGENRNKSYISKEAFEAAAKSMFNCPVVCNYDRDSDTLGGHDVSVIRNNDGELKVVNVTTPVGCVPESARYWWESVEEDDNTTREYLFADVLLWKRQEAYQKIKRDGIVAHSMEITVKDGEIKDGIFHIYDFEFTAFALIGVEPCFEGSSLEVFAKQDFCSQFDLMMKDLKESIQAVNSLTGDDDKHIENLENFSMEGGRKILEGKMKIAEEYGINIEELEFSLDDYTDDELREIFQKMVSDNSEPENDNPSPAPDFALTGQVESEIIRNLDAEKIEFDWGIVSRYLYVDSDFDTQMVYCWDRQDWLLYGFSYTLSGDKVDINFESKKRMKYVIAEFDDGEQPSPFIDTAVQMSAVIKEKSAFEKQFNDAVEKLTSASVELTELREFKASTEAALIQREQEQVFSEFADLVGIEEFEELRTNPGNFSISELKEKCFAIRGRHISELKFSTGYVPPKLKITNDYTSDEPYGGLFVKYGNISD